MKNNEKAVIAGAGVVLAYFFLQQKKEIKVNIPNLSISPPVFYV